MGRARLPLDRASAIRQIAAMPAPSLTRLALDVLDFAIGIAALVAILRFA